MTWGVSSTTFESSILTPNLRLEPVTPAHAEHSFQPMLSLDGYKHIPQDPPKSLEALRGRYKRWAERQSGDGLEYWLNYIVYCRQRRQYVGTLQATLSREKNYIAYAVFPGFWRQGIARESVSGLVMYLFDVLSLRALDAHVDTRNEASWTLLESLGFKRTLRISDADYFKGATSHEYIYALVKSDWLQPMWEFRLAQDP